MRFIDESGEVAKFHRLNAEVRGKFNTRACLGLGCFYKDGRGGLRRDGLKAKSWFTRCLSVSTDNAYKYINEFLENKEIAFEGTESEARKILPENFNKHQVSALVELHWIDKNTRDLDEIFDIAFRAKGGDAEAQYELGDLFMNASDQYFIPVIVRPRDGCEWMEKAAEQGYSKAYMPLALYYRGADRLGYAHSPALDEDAALYWAEQAYVANPKSAWREFANHYLIRSAGEKDVQKYIDIALESGDLEFAPFMLGQLFISGQHIEVDAERAAQYFAQSSCQRLRKLGHEEIEGYYKKNTA